MKIQVIGSVLLIGIVLVALLFIPTNSVSYDYLRLHIQANSNSEIDQNLKYKVKDLMVETLTPLLCEVENKEQAVEIVNQQKTFLTNQCLNLLKKHGLNYSVNIKINNEYFPARTYNNVTLESGYYDAVVVELGEGVGDNWWCVMYPPLCFVNKNEQSIQIKCKSKIVEWFKGLFG